VTIYQATTYAEKTVEHAVVVSQRLAGGSGLIGRLPGVRKVSEFIPRLCRLGLDVLSYGSYRASALSP
jgi:hypothetical protein